MDDKLLAGFWYRYVPTFLLRAGSFRTIDRSIDRSYYHMTNDGGELALAVSGRAALC
jgi:hypothetical protein